MPVKRVEVVERIWGDSLPFHLLLCESWIFVKEKLDRKKQQQKKQFCFTTCKNRLSVYVDERASWIFHHGGPYYAETSPLICRTNQWTGFYTTKKSALKKLMLCYLHDYYSIMTRRLTSLHLNIKGGCF